MSDPSQPGHPVGPEIDDSQNPTAASPHDGGDEQPAPSGAAWQADDAAGGSRTQDNVRDMLAQLQAMIDNVAEQAGPVLREVAAKAAELAAVAGERAGPLAYRAAERTQAVGQKVAQRSKEMAAEIRRQQQEASGRAAGEGRTEATAGDETSATGDTGAPVEDGPTA